MVAFGFLPINNILSFYECRLSGGDTGTLIEIDLTFALRDSRDAKTFSSCLFISTGAPRHLVKLSLSNTSLKDSYHGQYFKGEDLS